MKLKTTLLALLSIPALHAAPVEAANLGMMQSFVPVGSLLQGNIARPVANAELAPLLTKVQAKFNQLSPEQKAQIIKMTVCDTALAYSPLLWDTEEEYANYLAKWKRTGIQYRDGVAFGLKETQNPCIWIAVSVNFANGKANPLPLDSFSYNTQENTWTSPWGTLTPTSISMSEHYILGAQSGLEWMLEKREDNSLLKERIRITKSSDGQTIFVYYNSMEMEKSTKRVLSQSNYAMRLFK